MERYHYETVHHAKAVGFRVYDRMRGSPRVGDEEADRHVAYCRDRGDAERIAAALNATVVRPVFRGVFG